MENRFRFVCSVLFYSVLETNCNCSKLVASWNFFAVQTKFSKKLRKVVKWWELLMNKLLRRSNKTFPLCLSILLTGSISWFQWKKLKAKKFITTNKCCWWMALTSLALAITINIFIRIGNIQEIIFLVMFLQNYKQTNKYYYLILFIKIGLI